MFVVDCYYFQSLIEHDLVPGFQMHFHGTHLLGDVLARALYQPLAQVGGELRPGIGGDIDAATQRAAHVGGNLPLTAFISIEFGMKMPGCPSVSYTASSTGIIVP